MKTTILGIIIGLSFSVLAANAAIFGPFNSSSIIKKYSAQYKVQSGSKKIDYCLKSCFNGYSPSSVAKSKPTNKTLSESTCCLACDEYAKKCTEGHTNCAAQQFCCEMCCGCH